MNIVIADDEQIILKWLKKNIEALSPENHVVKACLNGKEVLNCCLNQKIDILFTDIRMPVMDGMELLKKLVDNQALPYTIILSAYDDFVYARDCFKLGVKEFLLKSEITKDELEKCLETANRQMNVTGNQEINSEETGEERLKKLVLGTLNKEAVSKDALKVYWKSFCKIQRDFILLLLTFEKTIINEEQVQEIVMFIFQEEKRNFYFIPKDEHEIILISENCFGPVREFADKVFKIFASFGYKEMFVSISSTGKKSSDIEEMYQEAHDVLQYQIFYGENDGKAYETLKLLRETEKTDDVLHEIAEFINMHQWNRIGRKLEDSLKNIREIKPDVPLLKHTVLDMLLSMYWTCLSEGERKKLSIDNILKINNCKTFEDLEEETISQMNRMLEILIKSQKLYSDAVYQVIKYIEQNYSDNISLEEIAKYVHMNRSYISHLFKKETGENIYTYLLMYRLEKAKNMLLENKESIQEISYKVGVPDSAYFSKLFKKHMGMAPLEFRKMNK